MQSYNLTTPGVQGKVWAGEGDLGALRIEVVPNALGQVSSYSSQCK